MTTAPRIKKRYKKRRTIRERIEMHSEPEPNTGCILWTGCVNRRGYGWIRMRENSKGVSRLVHRVVWELANGPVPEGFRVLHRCDQPDCLAIGHLFLGTQADNAIDMAKKRRGRASKTGMPFGVTRWKNRYAAKVVFAGRKCHLGSYMTMADAAAATEKFREIRHTQKDWSPQQIAAFREENV